MSEKQCLEWVKKITTKPEAEIPAEGELDADAGDDGGPLPRRLRRLFAKESGKRDGKKEAAKREATKKEATTDGDEAPSAGKGKRRGKAAPRGEGAPL